MEPRDERADDRPEGDDRPPRPEPKPASFGNISEHHWTRTRADSNQEAIEYLRQRSHAPGVESGGDVRNHYCMECNGVIPLLYDRRQANDPRKLTHCPHCGAKLDERVQAMFNWVEIDQVRDSDAKALLPMFLALLAVLALVLFGLWKLVS